MGNKNIPITNNTTLKFFKIDNESIFLEILYDEENETYASKYCLKDIKKNLGEEIYQNEFINKSKTENKKIAIMK